MNLINSKTAAKRKQSGSQAGVEITTGCRVSVVNLATGEVLDLKVVTSVKPGVQLDEVSSWSPLGKALWGRRVGESMSVDTPKGRVRYQILKIMEGE
jgi:transcription elongation factor GreA